MHDLQPLPPQAVAIIGRIEALLDEARPFTEPGAPLDDDVFALRETETRYLRETIDAYLKIPASLRAAPDERGRTADEQLLEQLAVLERATAERLARVAGAARERLATNGLFLAERFRSAPSLGPSATTRTPDGPPAPEAPDGARPALADADAAPTALPAVLVQRFMNTIPLDDPESAAGARSLLDALARRLTDAFPRLTRVRLGGLFAKRVESVVVELPAPSGQLRYTLGLDRTGRLEAGAARIVRGVTLKSERLAIEHWIAALLEHLGEFAESDRSARQQLQAFLR
jgi:hypothetical protein